MNTCLLQQEPFSPEQTAHYLADFHRDGFVVLRGILDASEVEAFKADIDAVFADPKWRENGNILADNIALRLFETSPRFEELLTREPIISLVEEILGNDCHLIAQNVLRNAPGQAIDSFHVDDAVMVPVAEGMDRHDARLQMPVFIVNTMFALTSIPSVEYGPTQYIPGSHYSGRNPNDSQAPTFEDREPVSLLCEPGDVYLFNNQGWHRGAPNTSDRTRYNVGNAYGRRCMAQRFFPFMNYRMPQHVIDNADERRLRVLGFHKTGAYG